MHNANGDISLISITSRLLYPECVSEPQSHVPNENENILKLLIIYTFFKSHLLANVGETRVHPLSTIFSSGRIGNVEFQ